MKNKTGKGDSLSILILAAGKGERMRSELPKVLHPLGGEPLLAHCLETARALTPENIVILAGHKAEQIKRHFSASKVTWAFQSRQLGTAHALLCGLKPLKKAKGDLLILYGDVPLLTAETLRRLTDLYHREKADLGLLTAELSDSKGYGRIVRGESGQILRIVEEKEATQEERMIREINCGIYIAKTEGLLKPLGRLKKSIVKGEYYLTDLIEELIRDGGKVVTLKAGESRETRGINSQEELASAEDYFQQRMRAKWMSAGVTLIDPETVYFEKGVEVEAGARLHPGVILMGKTRIGAGAEILPYSVIEDSVVGPGARIGPFAHLRPGSVAGSGSHVGNFVELKKTRLGKGSKVNHLAYLGDAEIGAGVNIGAGTITCNYDGISKFKTVIDDGAFIGSDTQLVAPVKIGKRAYVGSGTTVTKDVPAKALAVSRVEQKNILGWAKRKRKSNDSGYHK